MDTKVDATVGWSRQLTRFTDEDEDEEGGIERHKYEFVCTRMKTASLA